MSFDPIRPKAPGLDGLTEWCRRDRSSARVVLAAAAGDPVATAQLLSQLAHPAAAPHAVASIEILAARRSTQLIDLVGTWPDANDPMLGDAVVAAWSAALRHLESNERIDGDAALRGPLLEEAQLVIDDARPDMAPISWASFCDRASTRAFPPNELRTIGQLGFAEPVLDTAPLLGRPAALLRVLRGRWGQAPDLCEFVERYDVWCGKPIDLAVWWEAAGAIGKRDLFADRLGEAVLQRLLVEDEPARWWPAVLAALTDWVVP
jgi:hypothetical protein